MPCRDGGGPSQVSETGWGWAGSLTGLTAPAHTLVGLCRDRPPDKIVARPSRLPTETGIRFLLPGKVPGSGGVTMETKGESQLSPSVERRVW
jgi:hypothetical protein